MKKIVYAILLAFGFFTFVLLRAHTSFFTVLMTSIVVVIVGAIIAIIMTALGTGKENAYAPWEGSLVLAVGFIIGWVLAGLLIQKWVILIGLLMVAIALSGAFITMRD